MKEETSENEDLELSDFELLQTLPADYDTSPIQIGENQFAQLSDLSNAILKGGQEQMGTVFQVRKVIWNKNNTYFYGLNYWVCGFIRIEALSFIKSGFFNIFIYLFFIYCILNILLIGFQATTSGIYLRDGFRTYIPAKNGSNPDPGSEDDSTIPLVPKAVFVAIFAVGTRWDLKTIVFDPILISLETK